MWSKSGPSASGELAAAAAAERAIFRRFNRLYTRIIGTLGEVFLNTPYSLAEARVLYEVATRHGAKASDISAQLGLDPGYLSRMLKKFETGGLIRRTASAQDARYADLKLTPRGKSAFRKLDALSEEQARSTLDALNPAERIELLRCMRSMERILGESDGSAQRAFILRPHRIGDMGWIVHRESIGYAEQYGWGQGFEALIAEIVRDFLAQFDVRRERCWIAEMDGQNVGHIFLIRHPTEPDWARLRLLFVEPSARGLGIGDALVKECVSFARSAGYRKVVLWTHSILTTAHRIYQQAGFRLTKEEPHHSFGHDLLGQEWELDLTTVAR